jgi:hypothetical protein
LTGRCIEKEVIIFVGMGIIKQLHVAGGANIEQGLTVVGGFDADVITQGGLPVSGAPSFGSNTIVPQTNSLSATVNALQLLTTLTTSTAGSEVSRWLIQLLSGGTQLTGLQIDPFGLSIRANTGNPLLGGYQFVNAAGTVLANISCGDSGGPIFFSVNGIELMEMHSDTGGRLLSTWTNYGTIVCNGAQGQGSIQYARLAGNASAGTLALAVRGNLFQVTGSTTINGIVTTGWQAGTRIALELPSGITVTHNSGAPGASAVAILLNPAASMTTTAPYLLELWYNGTNWVQPGYNVDAGNRATAGGAVTDLAVSGLTGDTDGGYIVEGVINRVADGDQFALWINGAANPGGANSIQSDCFQYQSSSGTPAVVGASFAAYLQLTTNSGAFATNAPCPFRAVFGSKSNERQLFESSFISDYQIATGPNFSLMWKTTGQFTATSQITSVGIHSLSGAHIGTGSFIKVMKRGFNA